MDKQLPQKKSFDVEKGKKIVCYGDALTKAFIMTFDRQCNTTATSVRSRIFYENKIRAIRRH